MGGEAIAPLIGKTAKRFDLKTRNLLISSLSSVSDLVPIREIKEKTDFGDIDFLCSSLFKREEVLKEIIMSLQNSLFSFRGKITNDNIYSLAFDEYQIDIIFIDPELRNVSYYYFADNDRGNLIGSIYHQLGFSYGHKGLFLKLEDSKICLSTSTKKILQFLECSDKFIDKIFNTGFETFNEMYEEITKIPYFSSQYFKLENLNNKNRTRNKKRNTFINFIDFLSDKEFNDPTPNIEYMRYKSLIFFNKEKEFVKILNEREKNKVIRKMFSGDTVSEVTGLKGKKLGEFIIYFKNNNKFVFENIHNYNLNTIKDIIKNDFIKFCDEIQFTA
jgi:hypothetical protein